MMMGRVCQPRCVTPSCSAASAQTKRHPARVLDSPSSGIWPNSTKELFLWKTRPWAACARACDCPLEESAACGKTIRSRLPDASGVTHILAIKSDWPEDIALVQKGGTASLAIQVPPVDMKLGFAVQEYKIKESLETASRLSPCASFFECQGG